jgi:hypothetical protein
MDDRPVTRSWDEEEEKLWGDGSFNDQVAALDDSSTGFSEKLCAEKELCVFNIFLTLSCL